MNGGQIDTGLMSRELLGSQPPLPSLQTPKMNEIGSDVAWLPNNEIENSRANPYSCYPSTAEYESY